MSELSIHDLTRRSTTLQTAKTMKTIFQFTTSHGGRPFPPTPDTPKKTFNSRPHTEVDTLLMHVPYCHILFQFTTSHGGRRYGPGEILSAFRLSLHVRPLRSRLMTECLEQCRHLSIHDLTRRSTRSCIPTRHSQYAFQFTTSHGGRRLSFRIIIHSSFLSIHDLTRRSTCGRSAITIFSRSFNSRPHTEVDHAVFDSIGNSSVFQFTTSHGGRRCSSYVCTGGCDFQFTTSHGGRRSSIVDYLKSIGLSIHDLTRRSTSLSYNFPFHE